MGLLDVILGRTKPAKPNLDQLFGLSGAGLTLQAAMGFAPTGVGSVCYREMEGQAFYQTQSDITELLDADQGPKVEKSTDNYGYTWLVCRHDPQDMTGLVTDLHAVNSTLEAHGFGPALLCSLVGFQHPDGRRLGLVYLYKQGSFYPFAPTGAEQRNSVLELQVKDQVADDLRVEQDTSRWFPVWAAPGL
ncbi:MAG: PspA-associated protein PspAB [Nocardioidaceae bacterium]